jgi:hypothetical protein
MSSAAKKKPSKWRSFLKGTGSILVLDPAAGPPPVTRQQLAAERAARMKAYDKGRKCVVTLMRPAGAAVGEARTAMIQVAEGTARLIEAEGRLPRTLTQLMVFGHKSHDLGADVPAVAEGVR